MPKFDIIGIIQWKRIKKKNKKKNKTTNINIDLIMWLYSLIYVYLLILITRLYVVFRAINYISRLKRNTAFSLVEKARVQINRTLINLATRAIKFLRLNYGLHWR